MSRDDDRSPASSPRKLDLEPIRGRGCLRIATIASVLCFAFLRVQALAPPQQHHNPTASDSKGTAAGFSINPSDIALAANQGQHFEVTDPNGKFVAVRWVVSGSSCSGSDCGTIDSDGNYLAPEELTRPLDVVLEAVLLSDVKHTLFTRIQLAPDPGDLNSTLPKTVSSASTEPSADQGKTGQIQVQPPSNSVPAATVEATAAPKPGLAVTYRDGKLKIDAENTTLAAVLNAIAQKTGAVINVPPGSGFEPVVEHAGPALPDEILTQLLTGSPFNFIIVNSPQKPSRLTEVLLSMRAVGAGAVSAAAIAPAVRQPMAAESEEPESPPVTVPPATTASTSQEHLSPDEIEQMMKEKAREIREMAQQQQEQEGAQQNNQQNPPQTTPPNTQPQ